MSNNKLSQSLLLIGCDIWYVMVQLVHEQASRQVMLHCLCPMACWRFTKLCLLSVLGVVQNRTDMFRSALCNTWRCPKLLNSALLFEYFLMRDGFIIVSGFWNCFSVVLRTILLKCCWDQECQTWQAVFDCTKRMFWINLYQPAFPKDMCFKWRWLFVLDSMNIQSER